MPAHCTSEAVIVASRAQLFLNSQTPRWGETFLLGLGCPGQAGALGPWGHMPNTPAPIVYYETSLCASVHIKVLG